MLSISFKSIARRSKMTSLGYIPTSKCSFRSTMNNISKRFVKARLSRVLVWTYCCCSLCTHCCATHLNSLYTNPGFTTTTGRNKLPPFASLAFCYGLASSRKASSVDNINYKRILPFSTKIGRFSSRISLDSKRLYSSSSSQHTESSLTSEVLAEKLMNDEYSNVVVLVGAGASCSAGIPDFRTPGTGLYDRLDKYQLPMPESIFDLDYYTRVDPMPFVDLCQTIWPGQEGGPKPTPTHHFMKLLEQKGILRRIYTQNIDGLEALAGVSVDKLVECHGHFRSSSCTKCKQPMPIDDCYASIVKRGLAPVCSGCGGLVKPDIVFFGEELPSRFQDLIDQDMAECDLLLVVGTSLLVMPVAGIPSWVARSCPRVLLNREPAGQIGRRSGDLFWRGDCDDSVKTLCHLAGWTSDIEELCGNVQ